MPAGRESNDRYHAHCREERHPGGTLLLLDRGDVRSRGFNFRRACAGALFDGALSAELRRMSDYLSTDPFTRPAGVRGRDASIDVINVGHRAGVGLCLAHFGSASSSLSLVLA